MLCVCLKYEHDFGFARNTPYHRDGVADGSKPFLHFFFLLLRYLFKSTYCIFFNRADLKQNESRTNLLASRSISLLEATEIFRINFSQKYFDVALILTACFQGLMNGRRTESSKLSPVAATRRLCPRFLVREYNLHPRSHDFTYLRICVACICSQDVPKLNILWSIHPGIAVKINGSTNDVQPFRLRAIRLHLRCIVELPYLLLRYTIVSIRYHFL